MCPIQTLFVNFDLVKSDEIESDFIRAKELLNWEFTFSQQIFTFFCYFYKFKLQSMYSLWTPMKQLFFWLQSLLFCPYRRNIYIRGSPGINLCWWCCMINKLWEVGSGCCRWHWSRLYVTGYLSSYAPPTNTYTLGSIHHSAPLSQWGRR